MIQAKSHFSRSEMMGLLVQKNCFIISLMCGVNDHCRFLSIKIRWLGCILRTAFEYKHEFAVCISPNFYSALTEINLLFNIYHLSPTWQDMDNIHTTINPTPYGYKHISIIIFVCVCIECSNVITVLTVQHCAFHTLNLCYVSGTSPGLLIHGVT